MGVKVSTLGIREGKRLLRKGRTHEIVDVLDVRGSTAPEIVVSEFLSREYQLECSAAYES